MKHPQELEIWYLIPAIRKEMTRAMLKKGLTQREVARKLGVTDAAISQYIKSKRASEVRFDPAIKKQIALSAGRIMKGENHMRETQRIVGLCRKKGVVCGIGKKFKDAPAECRLCKGKVCFHD